jgi:hypothetical protein
LGKKTGEALQVKLDAVDSQYAKLFRDIDDYSKKTNGKGLDRRPDDPASPRAYRRAKRDHQKLRHDGRRRRADQ